MRDLLNTVRGDGYGVLGNHDTIRMAPDLERMGVRILLSFFLPGQALKKD